MGKAYPLPQAKWPEGVSRVPSELHENVNERLDNFFCCIYISAIYMYIC